MATSAGGRRKPAGSRDLLKADSLTALFPGQLVQTVATLPVFLIYLPQHDVPTGELLLAQAHNFTQPLYRQLLELPASSGLLRIEVATNDNLDALALDTIYDWQFTLISLLPGRGQLQAITAHIQRVAIAPNVQTQLNQASPLEKATIYQSLNLPYDAYVELDSLRRQHPNDATVHELWSNWMVEQGWDYLADVSTIG